MSRFVVYVTEKRKRKTVLELAASSLDIGSRSTCALTLKDPVVAERHCDVVFDPKREVYTVTDLGSTTGTYLNGVLVSGPTPLAPGDALVLGTTRLSATVEPGSQGPVLHLELQERAFQFQKAEFVRSTGDWIQGDRERWVESELNFSRFPILRAAVWGSLLLVGLAPLLLVNSTLRAKTFQPGPLASAHAGLFDGSAALSTRHAAIAAEGCQACHEPLNGIPISNCYACHESTRRSHPGQDVAGAGENDPNSCLGCHVEHRGGVAGDHEKVALAGAWEGRSVRVPVRAEEFVPTASEALCEECHAGLVFDDGVMADLERQLASAVPVPADGRSVKIPYDTFSHADHVSAAIECKACHLPALEGATIIDGAALGNPLEQRDFLPMRFEGCMGCHGATDLDPLLRSEIAHGTWPVEPPTFPLAWHGATSDASACEACHAEAYAKPMRTVTRDEFQYVDPSGQPIAGAADDPSLLFAYSIRHHTEQFEAAMAELPTPHPATDENCASCHVDGDWITAGDSREGRFYHGLHLAELHDTATVERLGSEDAGRRRLAESAMACDECHSLIMDSAALAQPFYRAQETSCAECHRTHEGDDSAVPRLIDASARMRKSTSTAQVAFPHDAHTNPDHPQLTAGCYSCHSFEPSDIAFRDPVVTPEAVKNCTKCHDASHGNVAGGSCSSCHLAGDPVFGSRIADADWALEKQWPAVNTFNHFSRGHLEVVESSDCERCHASIDQAQTIMGVRLPIESDAACRDCHIESRERFHWR